MTSFARVSLGRLGVVDRDGDLILPGALQNPDDPIAISPSQHSLIRILNDTLRPDSATLSGAREFLASIRSLWAGTGKAKEENGEIVLDVSFDDTDLGKSVCAFVAGAKPDWSMGFPNATIETRAVTEAEQQLGAKRVITGITIIEASPVDMGAGVAQGTLAACCGSCDAVTGGKSVAGAKCGGSCQSRTVAAGKCGSCALARPTPDPIDAAGRLIRGLQKSDITESTAKELRALSARIGKLIAPEKSAAATAPASQATPPVSPAAAAPAPRLMDAAAQSALAARMRAVLNHRIAV